MYFTISLMFFILVSNNKEEVKMNAPYKYDIVGSFLRDKEIKQAREDFSLGKINQSQLEEIENKSIENLVNEEKVVGLKAVTDGEELFGI